MDKSMVAFFFDSQCIRIRLLPEGGCVKNESVFDAVVNMWNCLDYISDCSQVLVKSFMGVSYTLMSDSDFNVWS